jgi:heme oxygenase
MKPVRFLVAAASPHHSLRSATQTSHDALERLPVMRRLMSPDVTRDDYAEVLTAFHAAHSVLEPVIERAIAGDAPVRLSDFGRIDDLYADLRQLGVATTLVAVENSDLQALRSPPGALGGLYVIEGARLGGRLISEHLRRSLGSEICLHYFGGSGRRTAPFSWKAF